MILNFKLRLSRIIVDKNLSYLVTFPGRDDSII